MIDQNRIGDHYEIHPFDGSFDGVCVVGRERQIRQARDLPGDLAAVQETRAADRS